MAEYKTTIEKTDKGTRITQGNMTKEEYARLAAERERTKDMDVDDAAKAGQDSLEKAIQAKKRFTEMQNMLAAGKHKDMTDEQKEKFVAEYKKLKADYSFAKGGMPKQMELFEPVERGFDEGGLMDEGGMVDEESGNEVPPGSLREEVRDDIPAQLSEGEFVFPADVVRYIGLENLMRMRQEAKQGLAQMEAMGQMGNSEEATVQDDLPFDMYDLDVEDDGLEMQTGGLVPASAQQSYYSQPTQVNPQTGTYILPGSGTVTRASVYQPTTGYTPYTPTPFFQPIQLTGPQFQTATQTTNLPTFGETVGTKPGEYDELITYINDAGQTLQIPFKDGKPLYPIPAGYRPIGDQPQEETTVAPTLGETQVMEPDRGGDNSPGVAGVSEGTGMPGYNNSSTRKGLSMLSQEYADLQDPFSIGIHTVLGVLNPVLGLVAKGLIDKSTYDAELSRLAEDYSFFGSVEDVEGLATTIAKTAEDYANAQKAFENATTEGQKSAAQNAMSRAKASLARDATRTAGRARDADTDTQGIAGLEGFNEQGQGVSPGPGAPTGSGPGKGIDGSPAPADTTPDHPGMSDVQSGPENDGPDAGGEFGGDMSGAPLCLTENMKVKLNGVIDYVTNVNVGDIVGDSVVVEVMHKHMRNGYYIVNGELEITNDHPVLAKAGGIGTEKWTRTDNLVVGDTINGIKVTSLEYVSKLTPTVYIGTENDRYDVYTKGEVYTVHGQYKNITKQAA